MVLQGLWTGERLGVSTLMIPLMEVSNFYDAFLYSSSSLSFQRLKYFLHVGLWRKLKIKRTTPCKY